MCSPEAVIQSAGLLLQVRQQNQQADATTRALQQASDNTSVGAQVQTNELMASTGDEISERVRQSLIERRRLEVAANEGGIAGATVDRIIGTSRANEGRDITTIKSNAESRHNQIQLEQRGIQTGFNNQMASVQRPNYAVAGLQIASSIYANRPGNRNTSSNNNPRSV